MKNLFDVFISYGRADSKKLAIKLSQQLTLEGFQVWLDQKDIEDTFKWQKAIDEGIEKSHNFVFIVAPHAVKSVYCLKEIELAVEYNKRLIPLLHVDPGEFWDKVHPTIAETQFLPFQQEINPFEESFERLVSSLRKHSDYVELHTNLLIKALEWQRHQKQTNYLLTGKQRREAENWLKAKFDKQPPCIPTDLHCEFICESIKNANNLMTQVFLSYSEKDQGITAKILKNLIRSGITVWTYGTDLKIGVNFEQEINCGIERADNLVYFISRNSLESEYCQREIQHALAHNKRIIPLLIDATAIELMPAWLKVLQFIDLTKDEAETEYRASIDKLLNVLNQDFFYYQQHKILLVKALKWEQQNRNPSILLQGYNLQHYKGMLDTAEQRTENRLLPLQKEFIRKSLAQPASLALEVFISYSRIDSDFARKLNEALQIQGKSTWFDQESIASGTDFEEEIKRGIESSDNFLFIISPSSVNSPYCESEVEYARKNNKRIVTILYKPVDTTALPSALATLQWIDFNKYDRDFYPNFSELVRTLDTERDYVQSHTKWAQRAREWKKHGYSADSLLRGSEFSLADNWLLKAQENNQHPLPTKEHKAFIKASHQAIVQQQKAEEERRSQILHLKEEKMREAIASARRLKYFLVAVVVGFVVSLFLGRQAKLSAIQAISQYSEVLFVSNKRLDSLKEAIKAKQKLQQFWWADDSTQNLVERVLKKAVYGVRQKNSLSGHKDRIYGIDVSPDGNWIASSSGDKTVRIWNREGTFLYILGCDPSNPLNCRNQHHHTERIWKVAFSSDGQLIATASVDKTVKLWKWDNREGLYQYYDTLEGHSSQVWSVAFSPDSKLIATGSDDNTVKLWRRQNNGYYQEDKTIKAHDAQVYSVAFSPDSKLIASGSGDNTVKLWKIDGSRYLTLSGHKSRVRRVAFSPDGKLIATASDDNTIILWQRNDNNSYQEAKTLDGHSGRVTSISFSPDGKLIASGSFDATVKLWNSDGSLLTTFKGHNGEVAEVAFSPDGLNGPMIISGSWDKTVKLWQLNNQLFKSLKGHGGKLKSVAFSPDGKLMAVASSDNTIILWQRNDNDSYQYYDTLRGHQAKVHLVIFSPDGKLIASASDDKTAKIWKNNPVEGSYQEDKVLKDSKIGKTHRADLRGLSFSPDGQLIVTGSNDHTIKIWNTNGTLLHTLTDHKDEVNKVIFRSDGKLIASASDDHTVKVWDANGTLVQTLRGHSAGVIAIDISPDGNLIASAGRDKTVKLWKWDNTNGSYQEYKTLEDHKSGVEDVKISPDGKLIASGSSDKTVKLWKSDGTLYYTLNGHNDRVLGVDFSPDSQLIASASDDKTVILWDVENLLSPNQLLTKGCEWLKDYLENNSELKKSDRNLCN